MQRLQSKIQRLNNNKYGLYEALLDEYQFEGFRLRIDRVQPDPFAPPSQATLLIPFKGSGFDPRLESDPVYRLSFCDSFARVLAMEGRRLCKENRGSGNGGFFGIRYGQQKVIEGNAVLIKAGVIEARILIGLPAFGRTIASKEASEFLLNEIPSVVRACVQAKRSEAFLRAAELLQRQVWLREIIKEQGLIAFVGNNSVLPRVGGTDRPLPEAAVFTSPREWELSFTLPDGYQIKGMGIPRGVSLIAGGGYHGKSTLLSALSQGIYNHIGGDGREYCLTAEDAVFLRSEDGRPVCGTDISPFIHNLPLGKSSSFFESGAASGSSSQAANLMEALEAGCRTFLVDEDISATNFLIRDGRMRLLIPDEKETITPLVAHLPHFKELGVSFVMVSGALGGLLDSADRVLIAENFQYRDASAKAKTLAQHHSVIPAPPLALKQTRRFDENSITYEGRKGRIVVEGGLKQVHLGREEIDLSLWHQLADPSQYGTLAAALAYAKDRGYLSGSPEEFLESLNKDIKTYGWDLFSDVHAPGWRYTAAVRPVDLLAALCRLRALRCFPL